MRIKNKYHAIFEQLAILYHKKNLFNSSAAGVTLRYMSCFFRLIRNAQKMKHEKAVE